MSRPHTGLNGFLLIDKPAGPTSHDLIQQLRKILSIRRIGHSGTLDPAASGLMIIAVGQATRLLEYLNGLPKEYFCRGRLGFVSTTDDAQGEIEPAGMGAVPSEPELLMALDPFRGTIRQRPPVYSALKIDGRRAYEKARGGEEFEIDEREVTVHELHCGKFCYPDFELTMRVSTGTYVRSIVRDLGAALNSGAYCLEIRRTAIGRYNVEQAFDGNNLQEHAAELRQSIFQAADFLDHLPSVSLEGDQVNHILHGNPARLNKSQFKRELEPLIGGPLLLLSVAKKLIAVGRLKPDALDSVEFNLHPEKVFPPEEN